MSYFLRNAFFSHAKRLDCVDVDQLVCVDVLMCQCAGSGDTGDSGGTGGSGDTGDSNVTAVIGLTIVL
jgi:hypothetical protein